MEVVDFLIWKYVSKLARIKIFISNYLKKFSNCKLTNVIVNYNSSRSTNGTRRCSDPF